MPVYEYACMECESHFEELLRMDGPDPACPECGAADVLRQLSVFAAHSAPASPASRRSHTARAAAAAAPVAPAASRPRRAVDSRFVDASRRALDLRAYAEVAAGCTRCRLAQGRTQVVFGVGNPNADLMFVGEAPGFHEDKQGFPFVGQAGKLLDRLLAGIELSRADVYVANVIKCRPPGNRDPAPDEIESCEPHLFRQLELVQPTVVASLGNFATKLLSGKQIGITRVHGQEQEVTIGGRDVRLYPLYHPAAALYTPAMLRVLEEDFARLPALLGAAPTEAEPAPEPAALLSPEPVVQLGLF
ncbi:MAG: FmdB family zinc ribbon protein [Gaiellaceae bacterium]